LTFAEPVEQSRFDRCGRSRVPTEARDKVWAERLHPTGPQTGADDPLRAVGAGRVNGSQALLSQPRYSMILGVDPAGKGLPHCVL